jgi:simple sugar transport system ATP-binding protein
MMVGRPVLLRIEKTPARPGETLVEVSGLKVEDDRHQVAVDDLSLTVRAGEILGVAGVEGNGQAELVEALTGIRHVRSGSVILGGRDVTGTSTRSRLHSGVGHIPADRQRMGIILELPISDNLVLSRFDQAPYARAIVRDLDAVREHATKVIADFDIRAPGPDTPAGSLSGGNQQKVVVARELSERPTLLIAAQPTRGVDVGSIEFIHRRIVEQRDSRHGVLLVSSELDEILSLADRVAVMYRGRIVATLEGDEIDRERIGLLMAGAA